MSVDSSTRNSLRAAIRAIDQVVAPAVAVSGDQLAAEQIGLVRANLTFLLERVDQLPERSRFEFDHYRALALELSRVLAEHGRTDRPLRDALDAADAVGGDATATPGEIGDATVALRAAASRLVRSLRGEEGPVRRAVDARVLRSAHRMLEFERSWFLPQGWEPEPELVRPLEAVLADARAARPAEPTTREGDDT